MAIDLSAFHFLRAELLWLFIPLIVLFVSSRQLSKKRSSWSQVISPHLLKFLITTGEKQQSHLGFWLTAIIASIIIFAVSGPTFREKAVPVFQTENARVILLDLSLSMNASDIKPARIARAKHKIMDILEQSKEGVTGLVIYAGDAFIISPLTSDANTIASMVPTLATNIMPVLGSRPDIAIDKAILLLENAKQTSGQIIWLTDGIDSEYIDHVVNAVDNKGFVLSILAIGSEQGSPIPLPDGNGFLKDSSGNIIVAKLDADNLKNIAHQVNGQYVELSPTSDDVDFIIQALINSSQEKSDQSDKRISRWIEDGYWLSWIIMLLVIFKLFSGLKDKSVNLSVIILVSIGFNLIHPTTAQAGVWQDLWQSKDQQANQAFKQQDYKKASTLFQDQSWKGAADYKQGNFDAAIEQFSASKTIDSQYNLANSLAKSQKFEEAITQYNKVLEQQPNHEDALFNKNIVEQLQQQKEQQKNKDKQEDSDQQDKKDQESESPSDSDKKSDDKKQSEQQSKDNEDKKQQQAEQEQTDQQKKQEAEQQAKLAKDQRDKSEKDQALEHWLEKIPDDPGGLLRRKMYREYQRRGRQQQEKKVW